MGHDLVSINATVLLVVVATFSTNVIITRKPDRAVHSTLILSTVRTDTTG